MIDKNFNKYTMPFDELKKISLEKPDYYESLTFKQQLFLLDYSHPECSGSNFNKINDKLYFILKNKFTRFNSKETHTDPEYPFSYSIYTRKFPDGTQERHLKFHGSNSIKFTPFILKNAFNLFDPLRFFQKDADQAYKKAAEIVSNLALESKKRGEKFTLSGHSFGGGLAEYAMAEHSDLVDYAIINQPFHALGVNSDKLTKNQDAQQKIFYPRVLQDTLTPTILWHEYNHTHLLPIKISFEDSPEKKPDNGHNNFTDYLINSIRVQISKNFTLNDA